MIEIEYSRTPDGTPLAKTLSPYEGVGDFLTMEAYSTSCWPCGVLLDALGAIIQGEKRSFDYGGDAFEVHVTPEVVSLDLVIQHPPTKTLIPFQDFYEAVKEWCSHLHDQ